MLLCTEFAAEYPGADRTLKIVADRRAVTRGIGMKSSDALTVSLCREHHQESHRGEATFEAKHGICLAGLAQAFYQKSPYCRRLDIPS